MKKVLLERAITSILEDLERLPAQDRDSFMANNQALLEKAMSMDSDFIDFKLFDIDLIIEKQREMVRQLYRRDQIWFQHFRDYS